MQSYNLMEAARFELAFRRTNTVSFPINLRFHIVVGFEAQPTGTAIDLFLSTIGIDWLVIQTMVNKP